MKVVRLRLLLSGIFKYSAAQPIQPKFTDKRLFLPNAVLAKSACQSLIQFADRLFSTIYIIEDCNIHKNPRLYLQLIANNLGFLFEAEFF